MEVSTAQRAASQTFPSVHQWSGPPAGSWRADWTECLDAQNPIIQLQFVMGTEVKEGHASLNSSSPTRLPAGIHLLRNTDQIKWFKNLSQMCSVLLQGGTTPVRSGWPVDTWKDKALRTWTLRTYRKFAKMHFFNASVNLWTQTVVFNGGLWFAFFCP